MKSELFLFICIVVYTNADSITVINPDISAVTRPCSFDDLPCIRREFITRGWCFTLDLIPLRQNPDLPVKIPEITAPFPFFNITTVQKNVLVDGLGQGKITEFYINEKTNRAVLSVTFPRITINATSSFIYHRMSKEDITLITKTSECYHSVVITTVITGLRGARSQDFHTHAYVPAIPIYSFGEGFEDQLEDPELIKLFEIFNDRVEIAVQESYLIRAPIFARYYRANIICLSTKN